MIKKEIIEKYGIPLEILKEYESGAAGSEISKEDDFIKSVSGQRKEERRYDDSDIKNMSIMMTLHDIGFGKDETKEYIRLLLEGGNTAEKRMAMLRRKRSETLCDIHELERCIENIDYLRYELQKEKQRFADCKESKA